MAAGSLQLLLLPLLVKPLLVICSQACPFPSFYAPAELPIVHEVEMLMPRSAFRRMVNNQADRGFPETPATVILDGIRLPGAKIQVHGGTPQRTGNNPKVGPVPYF
jgi:hypothetical protein